MSLSNTANRKSVMKSRIPSTGREGVIGETVGFPIFGQDTDDEKEEEEQEQEEAKEPEQEQEEKKKSTVKRVKKPTLKAKQLRVLCSALWTIERLIEEGILDETKLVEAQHAVQLFEPVEKQTLLFDTFNESQIKKQIKVLLKPPAKAKTTKKPKNTTVGEEDQPKKRGRKPKTTTTVVVNEVDDIIASLVQNGQAAVPIKEEEVEVEVEATPIPRTKKSSSTTAVKEPKEPKVKAVKEPKVKEVKEPKAKKVAKEVVVEEEPKKKPAVKKTIAKKAMTAKKSKKTVITDDEDDCEVNVAEDVYNIPAELAEEKPEFDDDNDNDSVHTRVLENNKNNMKDDEEDDDEEEEDIITTEYTLNGVIVLKDGNNMLYDRKTFDPIGRLEGDNVIAV
jgi:hypothetical protein